MDDELLIHKPWRQTSLEPLLYKPEQAAEIIGIGRSKIFELMAGGQIASVQIGRYRRIPRESLERYVRELLAGSSAR